MLRFICARRSLKIFYQLLITGVAWSALVSCSFGIQQPASALVSPTSTNESLITLHYNERPPYLVTTETGVGGLTGDPTTLVFEKSNIPFQWEQTPSKRQIYILQQNSGRDCLVGWFKNARTRNLCPLHATDLSG